MRIPSRASFVLHWSGDPAFDKSDPEAWEQAYGKYLETGDTSSLPVREGQTPIKFHCRPLTREEFKGKDDFHNGTRRCEYLLQHSLTRIEGLEGADGAPLGDVTERVGGKAVVSSAVLDQLYQLQGEFVIQELGTLIYKRSTADPLS